jgi:hypothetical protein
MTQIAQTRSAPLGNSMGAKIDAAGWGLFFMWLGVVVLLNLSWGVGTLGVGVIALGAQVVRKYFGLRIEEFGLVLGILLFVAGLWDIITVRLGKPPVPDGFLPILSVVVGITLFTLAILRKTND